MLYNKYTSQHMPSYRIALAKHRVILFTQASLARFAGLGSFINDIQGPRLWRQHMSTWGTQNINTRIERTQEPLTREGIDDRHRTLLESKDALALVLAYDTVL